MIKFKIVIGSFFLLFYIVGRTQSANETSFDRAFIEITKILDKPEKDSFQKAVFEVENAFYDDQLEYENFDLNIEVLGTLAEGVWRGNQLIDYKFPDSIAVGKAAAIFHVMKDTTSLLLDSDTIYHRPFIYDFEDFFGDHDWSKMFVTKLLDTGTGNCHSLPYLFKILANKIGTNVHLAVSSNHIYIKHHSQKTGWYNVELTSGTFPIDAWMMASGYVTLDAIRSGIFMKALSEEESIALCLVDLARGFKRKYPHNDGKFIEKCTALAMLHFPECIDAMLINAEVLKNRVQTLMFELSIGDIQEAKSHPEVKEAFLRMQDAFAKIHQLGFRQMPKTMYMDWLMSVKDAKYQNSNIGY